MWLSFLLFKKYFHRAKNEFYERPFVRAKTFNAAYLTDMLQYLVYNGVKVDCVTIERGWLEIDTVQDFERAKKMVETFGDVKVDGKI